MTKTITAILLLSLFLVTWLFVKHEESHESELEAKELQYKTRIDSIKAHYRELILEDSITFQHYADAKLEAERARNESDIWKRRYEHEKNNHHHFSPDSITALLSRIPD